MAHPPEATRPRDGQPQPNPFMDAVVRRIGERDVPNAAVTVISGLGKSYLESMINRRKSEAAIPNVAPASTNAYLRDLVAGRRFVLHALGQEAVAQVAEKE